MKTALITGSTQGIGRKIGVDLLDNDYYVYFNGHSENSIKKLQHDLNYNYANNKEVIAKDLSTIYGNLRLAHYFISSNIHLDALILNLGITDRTSFGEIMPNMWNKVIETNLSGAFFLIQELRNNIKNNGRIIFISSILSKIPHGVSGSYAASKAGINALVPYLAKEFSDKKITVNAICPGFVKKTNWHINKSKMQINRIEKNILLKRFAEPNEISSLVMEIIKNQYINGTTIDITGGYFI